LQESLEDKYNFYYAINGHDALEKLIKIRRPNIIICDIMMDVMDGYEFYEYISLNTKYNSLPFIFLTAKSSDDDRINGLSIGAIDFISKPFNISELMVKIDSLIVRDNKVKSKMYKSFNKKLINFINKDTVDMQTEITEAATENNIDVGIIKKYNISKKEADIMDLLFKGLMYKEIAAKLNISVNTVNTHTKKVYKKFNVQTKSELINKIYQIKDSL
jgi:DNA-binding NarL/FixJ family response regulator